MVVRVFRCVNKHVVGKQVPHMIGSSFTAGFVILTSLWSNVDARIVRHEVFPTSNRLPGCVVHNNKCVDAPWVQKRQVLSLRSNAVQHLERESAGRARRAQVVVARAGEDVRWLDHVQNVPIVVYDRAGPAELLPSSRQNMQVVKQANIGREDEVFIRHIVENYDNLPEVTIFLQGWPFGHCSGIINLINLMVSDGGSDIATAAFGDRRGNLETGTWGLVPFSSDYYQYSLKLSLLGLARRIFDDVLGEAAGAAAAAKDYNATCTAVLGSACPDKQWVSEGAQWAVHRDRIRLHPRSTYERILGLGEGVLGKFRGLVLEALFPIVFGAHEWSPMSILPSALQLDVKNSTTSGNVIQKMRTKTLASTKNAYCQMDATAFELSSCEQRMGFCELEWFQSGRRFPVSEDFLRQRGRFVTSGEPNADNLSWALHAQMRVIGLTNLSTFVHADAAGFLSVRFHGSTTSPSTWRFEPHRGSFRVMRSLLHSTSDGNGTDAVYFGCDPSTGRARLVREPVDWRLVLALFGRVRLDTHRYHKGLQLGFVVSKAQGVGTRDISLICGQRSSLPGAAGEWHRLVLQLDLLKSSNAAL
eukprot:TRINITY_DN6241_c0_g1_i2.p1 TRINITY_DN6241_c0_g1~~TRINITY_DN6241_c0_g1_i2.p1  ORF type:complete len:613 (-),score=88.60 TRINITY_DN6241_c0_g1_i2:70-1830(-)